MGALRAFTLIEILVVIALMAAIVGALGWGASFFRPDQRLTPDEKVLNALRAAREAALLKGQEVQLFVSEQRKSTTVLELVLRSGPVELERFPIATGEGVAVQFQSVARPDQALSLIGGDVVRTGSSTRAVFYPDGTCSRFRVQVTSGKQDRSFEIDPWTCAPVLPKPEGAVR